MNNRTDSLGEIIDKLITNCIKQYMQEDIRHSGSDKERLAASDKITELNRKRWKLINAINELIDPTFNEYKDYDQSTKTQSTVRRSSSKKRPSTNI